MRLGLLVSSAVVGVMALLTGVQLALELDSELRDREARLAQSLAPLVTELRRADTMRIARGAIGRFHSAYVAQGHLYHELALLDAEGRVVVSTLDSSGQPRQALLKAALPAASPALGHRPGTLRITEDGSGFYAARSRRWWNWAVHMGTTALTMLALLFVVIRREVVGPIDRLLSGVRKMEQGYWDDIPDPGGAWEVRWLGWRFRTLGQELDKTVRHLLTAQQRAHAPEQQVRHDSGAGSTEMAPASGVAAPAAPGPAVAQLHARLERLRDADPNDAEDRAMAQSVWDQDATHAERLGQLGLAAQLEDAALRVLDPHGWLDIATRVDAERPALQWRARQIEAQIKRSLQARGLQVVKTQRRIKHAAGIWRKMRLKALRFEQVHDLVALRIVVPAEADCYHTLGVVHELFVPIVGRFKDYIVAPKSNGYRSLHCSVRDAEGSVFEVQIRSVAMHRHAEMGTAAHANYRVATRIPTTVLAPPLWRWISGFRWQGRHR